MKRAVREDCELAACIRIMPDTSQVWRAPAMVMLVLSRKVGERILIGDRIAVTVVRITGGGVRLGIEAPTDMAVIREELQQEARPPAEEAEKKPINPR